MKLNFNKVIIGLVGFTLLMSSCEKQLDIKPAQSIEATGALSTKEEISASIVSMYAFLKGPRLYGRDIIAIPEALSDNGYATNKSGRLLPEYNNTFGAHFTGTIWTTSYAAINQINLTLEAIPNLQVAPAVTAAEKALWEGQLYFLRGLYYFELMKAYAYTPGAIVASQDRGGVVVSLKGYNTLAESQAAKPARQSVDSVYKVIIADLKRAETNLLNSATERSLATKVAAQALLSRVYLYAKDYANVKTYSDLAITQAGSRLTDQGNYVANWRSAENQETLFQVKFALNSENIGVNESLQTTFTTLSAPGLPTVTLGFGDLVPTISLLNALGITLTGTGGNTSAVFTGTPAGIAARTSDVRNLLYEPGTSGRAPKSFVETTKFLGKNGFPNLDNVPVIRISEMYLNRAEAFATIGSPIYSVESALADLKAIKSKRYVGYTGSALETADNALSPAALYEEILNQRRIELAFEGHRFHDLKRLGRDIIKSLPSTNVVPFTDARILAPILQADVDGNSNLRQNFGY